MAINSENMKSLTPKQWAVIIDTMDAFDFDKVQTYMNDIEWCWHRTEVDGTDVMRVPTQSELREALRSMLIRAYEGMNLWLAEDPTVQAPYMTSCGGFTVYVWPNNSCQVYFSVTDWWVDEDTIEHL